jgi:hypothetical protein
MTQKSDNGRTHEPSLREITSEVDALKELMLSMFAERKLWADEVTKGLRTELDAHKHATAEKFASNDKAITKAEQAQNAYNLTHNDLARKMDHQYDQMMPRPEANAKFEAITKEVNDLRESRGESVGGRERGQRDRSQNLVIVGLVISTVLGLLLALVEFSHK